MATIPLFYGLPLSPHAWYTADRQAFTAAAGGHRLTVADVYNQWLAIANLRDATYRAAAQPGPDGVLLYGADGSAVLHVLDLALWARERELLALLGVNPPVSPLYPPFGSLGYHQAGTFIEGDSRSTAVSPSAVAAVVAALPLPAKLLGGIRIFVLPYDMPQEFGLTSVYGPGIRIWLGAGAAADLRHVVLHELGHAIQFRYGGYDTVAPGQPLSAFWQRYLAIRGLTYNPPGSGPWGTQTPECFAEDFAFAFDPPGDSLGYEAACPVPTTAQLAALMAFWRGLPGGLPPSPFQSAQWVRWRSPWRDADFGGFEGYLFTDRPQVPLVVALAPGARGSFALTLDGGATPIAILHPGATWSGTLTVPTTGALEVDAVTPTLVLSSLRIYEDPRFIQQPRVSGVFPDTLGVWGEAAVAAAVRIGMVGGYPGGRFEPDRAVTRAQFARMLASALHRPLLPSAVGGTAGAGAGTGPAPSPAGSACHLSGSGGGTAQAGAGSSSAAGGASGATAPPPSGPSFADVAQTSWAWPFVAAVGGDLPGVGARFYPGQVVSWQEAVAWTVSAMGWCTVPPGKVGTGLPAYPDDQQVAAVDRAGFVAALHAGLIAGGAGSPSPAAPLDRAQAVVLILRALSLSGQG